VVGGFLNGAVNLAAGGLHSCVTRSDGTGRCWGNNADGEIGDGTISQRSTPVLVSTLSGAINPAGGSKYSCAAQLGGSGRCWGNNASGQLGNGTTSSSLTPVTVSGLNLAYAIATGEGGLHSCAARANGVPECWGLNSSGQLGNASTANSSLPVTVNSFGANINPAANLFGNQRVADVIAFVLCPIGDHVHVDVELLQDGVSGEGGREFTCTDRLDDFHVVVPATRSSGFEPGPAQAQLRAEIRDHGSIVDVVEWSRKLTLNP
jgi:hypothetical protein